MTIFRLNLFIFQQMDGFADIKFAKLALQITKNSKEPNTCVNTMISMKNYLMELYLFPSIVFLFRVFFFFSSFLFSSFLCIFFVHIWIRTRVCMLCSKARQASMEHTVRTSLK